MNVSLQVGRVALAQGDHACAELVFRETLHQAHEIGERFKLADPWFGLASAVRARGDLVGARGCFRQLVSELRAAACGHLLPRVVVGLAMFEAGVDNHLQAARLLGAFDASNAASATTIGWPLEGYYLGPDVATLRALFEQEAFAVALAEGRELTVVEALDEALEDGEAAESNLLLLDRAGLSAI